MVPVHKKWVVTKITMKSKKLSKKYGCQRNKTFEDKCTQTDVVLFQYTKSQCDLFERNASEVPESVQCDQSHTFRQSEPSLLTTHEITEKEINQIESITPSFAAGKKIGME